MSREIKFRCWVGKKMWYPAIYLDEKCSDWIQNGDMLDSNDFKARGGKYMQFTGLHDKNNKEIYEGDLIKHFTGKEKPLGVVEYFANQDNGAYFVCNIDGMGYGISACIDEVIGNIYENPKLLRVRSQ